MSQRHDFGTRDIESIPMSIQRHKARVIYLGLNVFSVCMISYACKHDFDTKKQGLAA